MTVDLFTVGPFSENTYLISDGGLAVVIDPGFSTVSEFKKLTEKLESRDLELQAVLLTHAHIDHVLGLKQVLGLKNVPVYLNHSDLYLWKNISSQAGMFGVVAEGFDFIPEPLAAGDQFNIGSLNPIVLFTPGHSPDHVSFYFKNEGFVISGDVLFRESIGRTDLYKGDQDLIELSIRDQLYTLPDVTHVYSGHGPSTTIAHEKVHNPFVRAVEP